MERISSYQELLQVYEQVKPLLDNRINVGKSADGRTMVMVCGGTGCQASESQQIVSNFERLIQEAQLADKVDVSITGCFGFCEKGPIVKIFPDNVFYVQVTPNDVEEIVETHLVQNKRVKRLLYEEPSLKQKVETQPEMKFYKKQQRIALRNCGLINPEKIEEYIANRGYQALGKALTSMTPDQVIQEVKKSGLGGRGGGGFLTGLKWEITRKVEGQEKFIICNADEGDPGAFMDRSIMEGDSHSVLEAMAIAGYAIGANYGYIYIRAEYPLAIKHLETAIRQAREHGLLGTDILGTGFDFDVELRLGAGAFVCGEETALLASAMGRRGMPIPRPPLR